MQYAYIDVKKFLTNRGIKSCEQSVMALIHFLEAVPAKNFILDGFPSTQKQAKIFFETFAEPIKYFFIEAEKDEVYERINSIGNTGSGNEEKLNAEFEHYLEHKDNLLDYISNKPYFMRVSGQSSPREAFLVCRESINIKIHFCNTHENPELAASMIARMEEKGYLHLDYEQMLKDEKYRGLRIGQVLAESDPDNFEPVYLLFRKTFYSEPTQNTQYIISNFPNSLKFLRDFPEKV